MASGARIDGYEFTLRASLQWVAPSLPRVSTSLVSVATHLLHGATRAPVHESTGEPVVPAAAVLHVAQHSSRSRLPARLALESSLPRSLEQLAPGPWIAR